MPTLESRKLKVIQQILGETEDHLLTRIETLVNENEAILKEKLVSRALKSEEDIKAGRVHKWEEVHKELSRRLQR